MPVDAHGHFVNRDPLQSGDLVIWTCNKDLRGSIGLVKKFYADLATVAFPEGEWNFKAPTLRKIAEGDTVRYTGKKNEVPTLGFGSVARVHPTGIVTVQWPSEDYGCEKNTPVKYVGTAAGIPKDEFGLVREHKEDGVTVQYNKGKWDNLLLLDLKLEFDIPYVALQYVDVKTALSASISGKPVKTITHASVFAL